MMMIKGYLISLTSCLRMAVLSHHAGWREHQSERHQDIKTHRTIKCSNHVK